MPPARDGVPVGEVGLPVRPSVLLPLFAPVGNLRGLGPRLAKLVERAAGPLVVDLMWHLPSGVVDRNFTPTIAEAPIGRIATLTVRVDAHSPPLLEGRPYKVRCTDQTGTLDLVFFRAKGDYLQKILPPGRKVTVSGRVEAFRDQPQITHPDHIAPADRDGDDEGGADRAGGADGPPLPIEPVYPLTTGLTARVVRRAIGQALDRAPDLPEWLDPALIQREGWPGWAAALAEVHRPDDPEAILPSSPARRRLAFDELLANQLALALVRHSQRRRAGRAAKGDGHLRRPVLAALPYRPTDAQERAIGEILADLESDRRMLRLLQGDVGSGKTLVALFAMLAVIETGRQAALMAPTELLARQHAATLGPLVAPAGLAVGLLAGRSTGGKGAAKARIELLGRVADGAAALVVGTHALFQQEVRFHDLGLVVIDEQHRFGVHQRLLLSGKGRAVDVLVMTATPIPRTLALTAYGDMDESRLAEKPPGRRPIDTRTLPLSRLAEVVGALDRKLAQGERVYWVCPLVEATETSDLAAAEARHADLAARHGDQVGLVHGRLTGPDKDAAMAAFATGATRILVATTVVEVGVDVPDATVMVIEHAERFGLAQLHQLRGRVGRGDRPGSCLLLYEAPLGAAARARLKIMRETEDGFRIAEEDLRLRGAGELLGTRQSGAPGFRLVDLEAHGDLMAAAHDDARLIVARDPELTGPRGAALRTLLYLFQRDAAVRLLRSG